MEGAFLRGIEQFNQREFFECHETLEGIWMGERGPRRLFLQGLIHFAVGYYHVQRGNPAGARRQLRKGLKKIAAYLPLCESVDTWRLYMEVRDTLASLESGQRLDGFPHITFREA